MLFLKPRINYIDILIVFFFLQTLLFAEFSASQTTSDCKHTHIVHYSTLFWHDKIRDTQVNTWILLCLHNINNEVSSNEQMCSFTNYEPVVEGHAICQWCQHHPCHTPKYHHRWNVQEARSQHHMPWKVSPLVSFVTDIGHHQKPSWLQHLHKQTDLCNLCWNNLWAKQQEYYNFIADGWRTATT